MLFPILMKKRTCVSRPEVCLHLHYYYPWLFFDGGLGIGVMRAPLSTTSPSAGHFRVTAHSLAVSWAAPEMDKDVGFQPLAASCAFKTRPVRWGAGHWGGLEGLTLSLFLLFFSLWPTAPSHHYWLVEQSRSCISDSLYWARTQQEWTWQMKSSV